MPAKKKVCLVVPEEDTCELLTTVLEWEGYEVSSLAVGEGDLGQLLSQSPDLLIIDFLLNWQEGWDFCQRLAGSTEGKKIPVIVLSALPDSIIQARKVLGSQVKSELQKSFDLSDFLREVRKVAGFEP